VRLSAISSGFCHAFGEVSRRSLVGLGGHYGGLCRSAIKMWDSQNWLSAFADNAFCVTLLLTLQPTMFSFSTVGSRCSQADRKPQLHFPVDSGPSNLYLDAI
jgi:hypothetical protein